MPRQLTQRMRGERMTHDRKRMHFVRLAITQCIDHTYISFYTTLSPTRTIPTLPQPANPRVKNPRNCHPLTARTKRGRLRPPNTAAALLLVSACRQRGGGRRMRGLLGCEHGEDSRELGAVKYWIDALNKQEEKMT